MARPRKDGLDYFPFDNDFFSDKKIKILKSRYGADGITLYIYLLCEIYKSGYYLKIDDDFKYIISDDLNMDSNKVMQVLNFLLERSLFDSTLFQSDKVLTSAGIQKRFQEAVKSRASKNPIEVKGFWLLSKEDTQTFIKVNSFLNNSNNNMNNSQNNASNSEKNDTKESKVKKSIENNKNNISSKEPPAYFENEKLNKTFVDFVEMRKSINSKMTDRAITLMVNKINKLNDVVLAIAMLEQSIMNSWKDIYPLKNDNKSSQKQPSNNKFSQFPQRGYTEDDYKSFEQQLLERRM